MTTSREVLKEALDAKRRYQELDARWRELAIAEHAEYKPQEWVEVQVRVVDMDRESTEWWPAVVYDVKVESFGNTPEEFSMELVYHVGVQEPGRERVLFFRTAYSSDMRKREEIK